MRKEWNIRQHGDVERLLQIAKRHLDYIDRSRTSTWIVPGIKPDHGLVASIFSAAAIEVGLNLFISIPVLAIRDAELQRFFGTFVTKCQRSSVRDKIKFATTICGTFNDQNELIKRVHALFDFRKAVLHARPEYIEPAPPPPELGDVPEEYLVKDPFLLTRGSPAIGVFTAAEHYNTATEFLDRLKTDDLLRRDKAQQEDDVA